MLSKEKFEKINRLLYEVSSFFQTRDRFNMFTDEIFTPKEKAIIVKRIAIIYLLLKQMNQQKIAEVLNISLETVSKFALIYGKRETEILNVMKALIVKEKILDFMGDILATFVFPTIYSSGRYARRQYEISKQKKDKLGL